MISSTTTRPPGRTTRAISARPRSRSEKLRAPKPTVAASNVAVLVGQLERVAPLEAQLGRLAPREREHLLGEVRADDLAGRPDAPRQLDREVARAGGDVERAAARPDAARSAARARQRWCSPAVMTEFMTS